MPFLLEALSREFRLAAGLSCCASTCLFHGDDAGAAHFDAARRSRAESRPSAFHSVPPSDADRGGQVAALDGPVEGRTAHAAIRRGFPTGKNSLVRRYGAEDDRLGRGQGSHECAPERSWIGLNASLRIESHLTLVRSGQRSPVIGVDSSRTRDSAAGWVQRTRTESSRSTPRRWRDQRRPYSATRAGTRPRPKQIRPEVWTDPARTEQRSLPQGNC